MKNTKKTTTKNAKRNSTNNKAQQNEKDCK